MNPPICEHPPLEDFNTRRVATLCDPCLIRLYELAVGLVPHDLISHVPNRFRTPECRWLATARVLGCVDPTPDEARLVGIAASVVAMSDEVVRHGAVASPWDLVSLHRRTGACGLPWLDRLLLQVSLATDADEETLRAAIDRVIEIAAG